jgi:hypothetical protein
MLRSSLFATRLTSACRPDAVALGLLAFRHSRSRFDQWFRLNGLVRVACDLRRVQAMVPTSHGPSFATWSLSRLVSRSIASGCVGAIAVAVIAVLCSMWAMVPIRLPVVPLYRDGIRCRWWVSFWVCAFTYSSLIDLLLISERPAWHISLRSEIWTVVERGQPEMRGVVLRSEIGVDRHTMWPIIT